MKIYVDFTKDKISAQQNTQRDIRDYLMKKNSYTSDMNEADILFYTQILPDDPIIEKWKELKRLGKKIVFIHHYMSKSFYEKTAIIKSNKAFSLIDYHIVISKDSELYQYLKEKNVDDSKIFIIELATTTYKRLNKKFFKSISKKSGNICYAARYCKGLEIFIDFLEKNNLSKDIYILCLDVHKCKRDLSKYNVFSDRSLDGVYEIMSKCKFLFSPTVYETPSMHLERSIQEALACGCIPIVDEEYYRILNTNDLRKRGFVDVNSNFLSFSDKELSKIQKNGKRFQHRNYEDYSMTIKRIYNFLRRIYYEN